MTRSSTDPAASMALLRDLLRDDVGREYVDAAQRRAASGSDPGTGAPASRSAGAARSTAFLLTAVLVAAVLAVGLVQRRADAPESQAAQRALVDRVTATESRIADLEDSIARTRVELVELQDAALADTVRGEFLSRRTAQLAELAGYTDVVGPGAVVTLDDAEGIDRADPAAPGRVLDSDVQTAVNGLWQAGAEAIAVNGRRLTATTAIRTAGSAILVDFRPLVPPYRVEAIGDPDTLLTAYAATRSAAELERIADDYDLRITSSAADRLELPAATALLPTRASVPTPGGASVEPSVGTSSSGAP
jgi:uncharacterized protein YlxW (UPF0749 family)